MPDWICDSCGERIRQIDDGWVEWLTHDDEGGQPIYHDLRLVHAKNASPKKGKWGCQHNEDVAFKNQKAIVGDLPLSSFVGPDGLLKLLEFSSDERFELNELIEMIKRIHVPGYDLARYHFNDAISDGVFEPNSKPGFYGVDEIDATIEWAKQNQRLG